MIYSRTVQGSMEWNDGMEHSMYKVYFCCIIIDHCTVDQQLIKTKITFFNMITVYLKVVKVIPLGNISMLKKIGNINKYRVTWCSEMSQT